MRRIAGGIGLRCNCAMHVGVDCGFKPEFVFASFVNQSKCLSLYQPNL